MLTVALLQRTAQSLKAKSRAGLFMYCLQFAAFAWLKQQNVQTPCEQSEGGGSSGRKPNKMEMQTLHHHHDHVKYTSVTHRHAYVKHLQMSLFQLHSFSLQT